MDEKQLGVLEAALRRKIEAEHRKNEAGRQFEEARQNKNEAEQFALEATRHYETVRQQLLGHTTSDRPTSHQGHMLRIVEFLRAQPRKTARAEAIVQAVAPEKEASIRSALARMEADGRLSRPKRGIYSLGQDTDGGKP